MDRYEVIHPEGPAPHPSFKTWVEALAAQKEWNKEMPGHRARKIPLCETPVEHTCPSCGGAFTGWRDQKGRECFECFAEKSLID